MDLANILTAFAGLGALALSIATFISMRRNRLAEAEKIDAETRQIIAETNREQEREISELRHDVHELSRRFDIATSYARKFYDGAVINAEYIRNNHHEEPPYNPPLEFPKIPTGPLGSLKS